MKGVALLAVSFYPLKQDLVKARWRRHWRKRQTLA
jgi:hypothetical protein